MSSVYTLRSSAYLTNRSFGISFLRDAPNGERKSRLEFHIGSGDYFGTLATILGLMADALSTDNSVNRERCIANLNELREDLVYLQKNYVIRGGDLT